MLPLQRGTGDPTMRVRIDDVWHTTRTSDGPAAPAPDDRRQSALRRGMGAGSRRGRRGGARMGRASRRRPRVPVAPPDRGRAAPRAPRRAAHPDRAPDRGHGSRRARTEGHWIGGATGLPTARARGGRAGSWASRSRPAPGSGQGRGVAVVPVPSLRCGAAPGRAPDRPVSTGQEIDALAEQPVDVARARLTTFPGVGPWTTAEIARLALGDADAVSIGDYHLPNIVAWALAREPRGDDERMLELLEPYVGHRGRVQLLLEAGGIRAPAFGPRAESRSIERIEHSDPARRVAR